MDDQGVIGTKRFYVAEDFYSCNSKFVQKSSLNDRRYSARLVQRDRQHLTEKQLINIDGIRIFNCDEFAFYLCRKGKRQKRK